MRKAIAAGLIVWLGFTSPVFAQKKPAPQPTPDEIVYPLPPWCWEVLPGIVVCTCPPIICPW